MPEQLVAICKRMKLGPYLIPCAKINSKWITVLDVRAKTLKLLEGNLAVILPESNTKSMSKKRKNR